MPLQDYVIQIADAMADELNAAAGTFSQPFTATRVYDYTRLLEDTNQLCVDVVPETHEDDPFTRQSWKGIATVSIAVRQKIRPEDIATIDGLTYFVGQLRDFWTCPPRRLNLMPAVAPVRRKIVYPYLQKPLRSPGQFVSVLQLGFMLVSQ